jgi:RNA polymerase sigma-70 factor (ECF subfamily)
MFHRAAKNWQERKEAGRVFQASGRQGFRCGVLTPQRGADSTGECSVDVDLEWRDQVVALIPALRAFAWSISRNGSDADDLVQDTLIKAWSHRDKFETGTNLRAWLFTILRNTYYTAVVRRRREVRDEDDHYARALTSAPTQEWGLAIRALQAALDQLPSEHREALILVGAAGLSYEEAADICGCALGTIKSRVNRARNRLLKLMEIERAADAIAPTREGAQIGA